MKKKRGNPGVEEKRDQMVTLYFTMLELDKVKGKLSGEESTPIELRKQVVDWSKK